ncbi:hypothetical protein TBLA_0F03940 [Henningerozyma blattae CBS 6284]|uniref:DUF4484 domain-containing protein n=1 Tax=Henningerozyma blattae (strain ATCC 34711 / CBS 6284 / DSM 70876 / NBRC 10599 / NRRL Y-10934 / UCD 77-7) TaxID=1071380 RepID=I2H6C6_HENB6|nr:hypothetical protein TBLA_0F03940 [Tetrapisispora blattae CBS 6284]CCH61928.1 hypothetical protein TBLA_0F03940 [Tetrapisispora blattae CBS 6284]
MNTTEDANQSFTNNLTNSLNAPKSKVPLIGLFLSQFDMKKGNTILWSQKTEDPAGKNLDLNGVEFKSLPSGIHEVAKDVILFTIPKPSNNETLDRYYGVACFQQNGQQISANTTDSHIARDKVKMYSIGAIVNSTPLTDDSEFTIQNLNIQMSSQYVSAHTYSKDLDTILSNWINKGDFNDFSMLEKFFVANNGKDLVEESNKNLNSSINNSNMLHELPSNDHMITLLPYWIRNLGPLLLPIWKACVARKRILIVNSPGRSFEYCNSLAYCLSILSAYPSNYSNKKLSSFIELLYTVGVSDMDYLQQYKNAGYIACTSDEVLVTRDYLYDLVLMINSLNASPILLTNKGTPFKSTWHDVNVYKLIMQNYLAEDISDKEEKRICTLSEGKTWLQFIIDNAYWITTAGYVKPAYEVYNNPLINPLYDPERSSSFEQSEYLSEKIMAEKITEYFQNRVNTIYNKLAYIIDDNFDVEEPQSVVSIPSSVLTDLDLDCFSSQDYRFLEFMCNKWFDKVTKVKYIECCGVTC